MEINGVHSLLLLYFALNNTCNRILPSPAPVYQVILRSESKFYNLIKICIILIVSSKKSYFDAVFLHRSYEVRQISLFNVPRQSLFLFNVKNKIHVCQVVSIFKLQLQLLLFSFVGEVDTRFSFCAIACLALLVSNSVVTVSPYPTCSQLVPI